jgi:hypothetical protein
MKHKRQVMLVAGAVLSAMLGIAATNTSSAQTSYVRPSPGGGYTIEAPGRSTTFVRPSPGGGYTIQGGEQLSPPAPSFGQFPRTNSNGPWNNVLPPPSPNGYGPPLLNW